MFVFRLALFLFTSAHFAGGISGSKEAERQKRIAYGQTILVVGAFSWRTGVAGAVLATSFPKRTGALGDRINGESAFRQLRDGGEFAKANG